MSETPPTRYRGLSCPDCGQLLEGVLGEHCPECGLRLNTDWLYSAEFVSARALRRWRVVRIASVVLIGAGIASLFVSGQGIYGCLVLAFLGFGFAMWIARWARS